MVILDSEANRFTPFLSMHKYIESFVSIKAQDERYCKYTSPPRPAGALSCKKSVLPQRILSYKNIIHIFTREGTDLYTAWYGQKNTPDK